MLRILTAEQSWLQKIRNNVMRQSLCIVLYSSIYIAPLNSRGPSEALFVRLAPGKETSFKKPQGRRKTG